jgi:hypothetical protein
MKRRLELSVVGIEYRVTPATVRKLQDGLPLQAELLREPDNSYDENAVKVVLTDKSLKGQFHIGYLSRQLASEIGPRMDAGRFPYVQAVLTEIDEKTGKLDVRMAAKAKAISKVPGN